MFCSNCGREIQDKAVFCSNCGAKIGHVPTNVESPNENGPVDEQNPSESRVNSAGTGKQVKENEFVKSVKNDIGNSQSLNMIKNKAASTVEKAKNTKAVKKINKKIIIAVVAVVAILIVVLNLHKCEECEKIYFGEKNTISFWGEYAEVCDECYEDYYSW